MGRDVLEELVVLAGKRQLDPRTWPEPQEIGRLVEPERVAVADEIEQVLGRFDRRWRHDVDDVSVDERLPSLASDRDAVVPVLDEVHLADPVELDRGNFGPLAMSPVDALPAISRPRLAGEERAVEIAVPANAPDDLIDRHLAQAAVALGLRVYPAAHLLEREQCVVGAPEPARDRAHERLPPRSLVVAAYDVRLHGISTVRAPNAFMTVVRPNCVVVTVRRSYMWVCPCR